MIAGWKDCENSHSENWKSAKLNSLSSPTIHIHVACYSAFVAWWELAAYGDINCSSRRVVGIAAERPLKHVVVAMWHGTVVHSVSIKTGKTTIMCVDSKHRPTVRTMHREEALRQLVHLKRQEALQALQ